VRSGGAHRIPWFAAVGIGLGMLSALSVGLSFSEGAAYPECSARRALPFETEAHYCLHSIRANQESHVPGQQHDTNIDAIWPGALLRFPPQSFAIGAPLPEVTSIPPLTLLPDAPAPHATAETLLPLLAELQAGHKALQTALEQQGTHIDGLLESQQQQGSRLEQQGKAIAALTSGQEQLTTELAALRTGSAERPSNPSFEKRVALTWAGAVTLGILGVFLFRVCVSRPLHPVPAPAYPGPAMPPGAPPQAARTDGFVPDVKIATRYLSTPKREDVILTASTSQLSALVLADGASSYRVSGGEISGGGRHAAEIAAHTAITYLTSQSLPARGMHDLLAHLHACFSAANTALETHNASTRTPGGTTLLVALLCQDAHGQWYWCYGNLGNGVLELLHSQFLLAGWPIHTPLLSNQSNGVTTLTMPGYAAQGYQPAVACKPHVPGDLLLIGSDGLDHLDTVTKKCNRVYFSNFLWKQIHTERSCLEQVLQRLHNGQAEAQWRTALELDDTTIGILWA
jgi:hypothetical protein